MNPDIAIQQFAVLAAVLGSILALVICGIRALWRYRNRRKLAANSDKER